MLAGAVLEEGMRRIATNNNVTVKRDDDLRALSTRLVEGKALWRLVQKQLEPWIEVRNLADHGRFDEYVDHQVGDMLRGVGGFLSEHLETNKDATSG